MKPTKEKLLKVLKLAKYRARKEAAFILGSSEGTIQKWMNEYGITYEDWRKPKRDTKYSKLNFSKATEIRKLYFQGLTQVQLSNIYNVSQVAISKIVNNVSYKEINMDITGEAICTLGFNYHGNKTQRRLRIQAGWTQQINDRSGIVD